MQSTTPTHPRKRSADTSTQRTVSKKQKLDDDDDGNELDNLDCSNFDYFYVLHSGYDEDEEDDDEEDFQYPQSFYDNLSQVWLTRLALRELDRRNRESQALSNGNDLPQPQYHFLRPVTRGLLRKIQEVAKEGGPDLSDLRGRYPGYTMTFRRSPYRVQKRPPKKTNTPGQSNTGAHRANLLRSKKSGPYDRNFNQHLVDNGVYHHEYEFPDGNIPPNPGNWSDINERLAHRRRSLSPSQFKDEMFEQFRRKHRRALKEKQVAESVISMIEGDDRNSWFSGGIPFNNLASLTKEEILVSANPDRCHGARAEQLHSQINAELEHIIVPSTQHELPILPNFFLAVKGPDGQIVVLKRQSCCDGALGARAMHSLLNYGKTQCEYDQNAYTISSTYHDSVLRLYAHYLSPSTTSDEPIYFMVEINAWIMTSNANSFREGATWYRNARDWAKEQRDEAIQQANERFACAVNGSQVNIAQKPSGEVTSATEEL